MSTNTNNTGYTDINGVITTNAGTNNTITLTNNTDTNIISNGNDTITIDNANSLTGTFSGESSITTETNNSSLYATITLTSNLKINGNYAEMNLSSNATNTMVNLNSNTSFGLNGDGSVSYIGNLNVTGNSNNASLSVDYNNLDQIYGVYDNLDINNNSEETVYSEVDNMGYINTNDDNNNINITANGANISLNGNDGNVNIFGENNANLNIYGASNDEISGSWNSVNGIVEAHTSINIAVNTASIYENGGNVTLTGESSGGNLSFNGTGSANIVGRWGAVTATFGQGQDFNAVIGDNSYITINDGANVDIWNSMGSHNAFQQNGGTLHMTMGSGYTGLSVNMNSNSITYVSNFTGTNGQIILQNMNNSTPLTVSYTANNNTTSITQAGSNATINLTGHENISTIPVTQNGASQAMLIIQ